MTHEDWRAVPLNRRLTASCYLYDSAGEQSCRGWRAENQDDVWEMSEESEPVRAVATSLFEETVSGSTSRIPDDLKAELPRLLWLYHMGVILFWIHDNSPGRKRSRTLVDGTVEIIARLISLAGNPMMRPLRKRTLALIRAVS